MFCKPSQYLLDHGDFKGVSFFGYILNKIFKEGQHMENIDAKAHKFDDS